MITLTRHIAIKGIALGIFLSSVANAQAQTLPQPVTDDLWDVSQGTVVTSHSDVLNTDHDARDAFGGTYGLNYVSEDGNLIFKDNLPLGTVHSLEWKTEQPIILNKFRVFAWHEVSRLSNCGCPFPDARVRGFETMRLYAKNTSGEFELVDEFDPIPPESGIYGNSITGTQPFRSEPFLYEADVTPVTAQEFKAEFVQRGDPTDLNQYILYRARTGPRIVELDGFGEVAPDGPDPIVIVPGLVGSHNRKCIIQDHCAPGIGTWNFTPLVDWYSPLITRLEAEGYTQGENLFIAFYDWRQSNIESAIEYLRPTIDEALSATGADKVDIIAHSMGGLVTRAYVQSGPEYRGDVDQLIMLGTPNEGAADAYTVWESGELPERWDTPSKLWVNRIERALRRTRNQSIDRPSSYREFFPSLAELVPINPFVVREGLVLNPNDLTLGNNLFLEALRNTIDHLSGINVLTIAGTGIQTLDSVQVAANRTTADIELERWRDGRANPNPPQPDSSFGDETVLVANVHITGSSAEIPGAAHDELPGKSQDLIANALLENPIADYIPSTLASSGLGIDVLSPVMPVVHGPNGEILSADTNTFENAVFDWDPNDPNSIKMLTIVNPPIGTYVVEYIGTGDGEYTIITTFADEDETLITERSGQATDSLQSAYSLTLSESSLFVPPEDITAITASLRNNIKLYQGEGRIRTTTLGPLNGESGHLHGKAIVYEEAAQQYGVESEEAKKKFSELQQAFENFKNEFQNQTTLREIDTEPILAISSHIQQLEDVGL